VPAAITVTLADIKMLAGVKGIDVLVDGDPQTTLQFGETVTVEVEPGHRAVQAILHGVVQRKSKTLFVLVPEGGHVAIVGKYSRLWGTIKLASA
jgi:glycine/serine hydroxymethyltransferase